MRPLALVATLLFAAPALAAPVDLSGTWVLDKAASESLDPLLKAQGVGWMQRQAVAGMDVTQRIAQSGDTLKIALDTSVKDRTETVTVDGVPRDTTTEDGKAAKVTHTWKGAAWVTVTLIPEAKDGPLTLTRTQTLTDGGSVLTQRIELTRPSGAPIAVTRRFRKQGP